MLIKHLAKSKVKKPNKQPTRLYGGRRNNSPWSPWPSRAAWDQSPCLLKHKGISSCLPQALRASSGMLEGHTGRGMFAAVAAAGALPLGAPWAQWGRTAWPRQGSSCSPRQRRHRGCPEFSACDRLTALQAEMLEPREGCREQSSSALFTSSPHVSGAHAAAAAGRWATSFSLLLPSELLWACRRTRKSTEIQTFLSETGFKKSKAFFTEKVWHYFFLFFSKVVLSCLFLQLEGRKLLREGWDHMIPGTEVWREKEICCKTHVTGQARNLEVL